MAFTMPPSGKIVGTLPSPPSGRRGMAVPVQMLLRLQKVVGNREVQRFLAPKPAIVVPPPIVLPPVVPPAPLRRGAWLELVFRMRRVRK